MLKEFKKRKKKKKSEQQLLLIFFPCIFSRLYGFYNSLVTVRFRLVRLVPGIRISSPFVSFVTKFG